MTGHEVFIASTNYAGSTVLGLILGNHSEGAFLGEPGKLLQQRQGEWKHRIYCALCRDEDGAECPVWTRDRVARLRAQPTDLYREAWNALGNPRFLVDASKDLDWYRDQIESGSERSQDPKATTIVHLTKSVESFVASVVNRNPGRGRVEFMADDWIATNRAIRRFASNRPGAHLTLRYEDLMRDPDASLARLGEAIGFTPEPNQTSFWLSDPHYVKGNSGTASHFDRERASDEPGVNEKLYRDHHQTLFLDEKWREVLRPREIDRIYALPKVEAESRLLGYEHPLARSISPYQRLRARTLEPLARIGRDAAQALRRRNR